MGHDTLLQPEWRSTRRAVNGLQLHVVEAGPESGPLLILLHGFPEFWWAWRHQITPLAERGYRVVAPDMRGYHLSDVPEGVAAYQVRTLAADVAALADGYGAERFHLVGHDWGGVVAWEVGARYPERLERLVVLDAPHPAVWTRQAIAHPTPALRSAYVAFFQAPFLPEAALSAFGYRALRASMTGSARPGTFSTEEFDRYVEAWRRPGRLTAMLNYYRALRLREAGAPARVVPPTLVLWGEQDSFLEHHLARASADQCEQGQLMVVAGTTHWLHLEEPGRVAEEIGRFLDGRDVAAAVGNSLTPPG